MKLLSPALTLLALTCVGCASQHDPLLDHPERALVGVSTPGGAIGSGFFVSSDGWVVTCAHLVRGHAEATVTDRNGVSTTGRVVQSDAETDLAVLNVAGSNHPVLRLTDADATPPAHVRIVGLANVTAARFDHFENFARDLGLAATVRPQDAGAPVLGDDGRVIGVVRGPGEGGVTVAAPAWAVARLLPTSRQPASDSRK